MQTRSGKNMENVSNLLRNRLKELLLKFWFFLQFFVQSSKIFWERNCVFFSQIACFLITDDILNYQNIGKIVYVREIAAIFFPSKNYIFKAHEVIVDVLTHTFTQTLLLPFITNITIIKNTSLPTRSNHGIIIKTNELNY